MSILSSLGLASDKRVRYAVVGVGDIAQEAMLPGIAHTGNSTLAALVTDDPDKARALGARYAVENTCDYAGFEALLRSGAIDAIYLATPNWRHAEFAVPALRAGIHVLVEKPLEVSVARCQEILDAQRGSKAKLMTAYRLHFEPGTLSTLELIRSGKLGRTVLFNSTFVQMLSPDNHRNRNGDLAGPLLDMGPYPVNAARTLFGAEPEAVLSATGIRFAESGLGDLDHAVSVVLRFPGDRLAQFVVSFYGNTIDQYVVVGTEGSVEMNPGYMFGMALEQRTVIGQTKSHQSFKATDQFGGQMMYFSGCILDDRDPEPDGEEGLADARGLAASLEARRTGQPQHLPPFARARRIDTEAQRTTLSPRKPPELVNASTPSAKVDAMPKN